MSKSPTREGEDRQTCVVAYPSIQQSAVMIDGQRRLRVDMNLSVFHARIKRLAKLALASFRTIVNEGWLICFLKVKYTLNQSRPNATRPILKIRPGRFDPTQLESLSPGQHPTIDIIIVTYNAETIISECLRSIQSSLYPPEKISIILVDNNSSDKTRQIVEELQSIWAILLFRVVVKCGVRRSHQYRVRKGHW